MQTPARGKPLGILTYWVVAFLALSAVVSALGVVSLLIERSLVLDSIAGRPVSFDEAAASNDRVDAIGTWTVIVFLVTGVLWLIWQHRAHSNLRSFGRIGLRYTPGWAVGWWFIPFASLWKPLGAMSELWKASAPIDEPEAWRKRKGWWPLGVWWACWIGGNLLDLAVVPLRDPTDLGSVASSDLIAVGSHLVETAAAVFAIVILRDILSRQRSLAAMSEVAPLPPPLPGMVLAPPMPPPPPMPPLP
jgi:uncharacterized protein DUF4328